MSKALVAACLLAVTAGNSIAQSFPTKPVTLICPCPPASAAEEYLSAFARIASKYVGHPVIAEQSRGAVSMEGLERLTNNTPPDGHLLSILLIPAFRLPHLQRVSWDPLKDFRYIIGLAGFTFGVVVKSDSPIKTINDLIAYAKANPGRLSYGAFGQATTHRLNMEELGLKAGVRFMHVHGSFAESAKSLIDGRIMAISDSSIWGPQVDAGAFRLLVTFGERRSRWNAPTAKELGIEILSYSPFGIVGPTGMDPKVVKLLHDAFNRTLDDPEYDKLLKRLDMVDWYKSSEDYADWAVDQFKFQRELIGRIGLGRR